jgi:hypothetical protein
MAFIEAHMVIVELEEIGNNNRIRKVKNGKDLENKKFIDFSKSRQVVCTVDP